MVQLTRMNEFRPLVVSAAMASLACVLAALLVPEWVHWTFSRRDVLFKINPNTNARLFLSQTGLDAGPSPKVYTHMQIKGVIGLWEAKLTMKVKAAAPSAGCEGTPAQCTCDALRDRAQTKMVALKGTPGCGEVKLLRCESRRIAEMEAVRWVAEMEAVCDTTIVAPLMSCGSPFVQGSASIFSNDTDEKLSANEMMREEDPAFTLPRQCTAIDKPENVDNCMADSITLTKLAFCGSALMTLLAGLAHAGIPFFKQDRVKLLAFFANVAILLFFFFLIAGIGAAVVGLKAGCGNDWSQLNGDFRVGYGVFFGLFGIVMGILWACWSIKFRRQILKHFALVSVNTSYIDPEKKSNRSMTESRKEDSVVVPMDESAIQSKGINNSNHQEEQVSGHVLNPPSAKPAPDSTNNTQPAEHVAQEAYQGEEYGEEYGDGEGGYFDEYNQAGGEEYNEEQYEEDQWEAAYPAENMEVTQDIHHKPTVHFPPQPETLAHTDGYEAPPKATSPPAKPSSQFPHNPSSAYGNQYHTASSGHRLINYNGPSASPGYNHGEDRWTAAPQDTFESGALGQDYGSNHNNYQPHY